MNFVHALVSGCSISESSWILSQKQLLIPCSLMVSLKIKIACKDICLVIMYNSSMMTVNT